MSKEVNKGVVNPYTGAKRPYDPMIDFDKPDGNKRATKRFYSSVSFNKLGRKSTQRPRG